MTIINKRQPGYQMKNVYYSPSRKSFLLVPVVDSTIDIIALGKKGQANWKKDIESLIKSVKRPGFYNLKRYLLLKMIRKFIITTIIYALLSYSFSLLISSSSYFAIGCLMMGYFLYCLYAAVFIVLFRKTLLMRYVAFLFDNKQRFEMCIYNTLHSISIEEIPNHAKYEYLLQVERVVSTAINCGLRSETLARIKNEITEDWYGENDSLFYEDENFKFPFDYYYDSFLLNYLTRVEGCNPFSLGPKSRYYLKGKGRL